MYFKSLSLTAISLIALQFSGSADAFPSFGLRNNLEIVHGGARTVTPSANYVSVFARDDDPEPDFELVPFDVKDKIVSLRKRGPLSGCTITHTAIKGETCTQIAKDYGIPRSQYLELNPSINSGCTNMWAGTTYCVSKENQSHKKSHKESKPKADEDKKEYPKKERAKKKTQPKEEPKEEESSSSCAFKHTVTSSDTCTTVSKQYGIDRDAFKAANPSINSGCTNMITGKDVCIPGGGYTAEEQKEESSSSAEDEKIKQSTTHYAAKAKTDEKEDEGDDGWEATEKPAEEPPKKEEEEEEEDDSSSSSEQRNQIHGNVPMTYYWIAQPQDYDLSGRQVSIKTCEGKTLGKTSVEYADALVMEGTGILGDKVVNLGACSCTNYNCFMEVDKNEDPYGLTSYGTALRPFITAAANDIARGTKIYVPQLDGWELPGTNKKHNGCLLVDDRGWSFSGKHIDFYVYSMSNYRSLNGEHGVENVDVYEGGSCKLINYF